MEFRQTGSSTQGERGSTWIPGLQENTTGTQQLQAPAPPFIPGLMGSNSQPSQSPTVNYSQSLATYNKCKQNSSAVLLTHLR